ncbi:MAG: hypothetical protein JWQ23_1864 [Herminiimonas sp.]|nr:hypothetical protein [Herminiimonas sp.]
MSISIPPQRSASPSVTVATDYAPIFKREHELGYIALRQAAAAEPGEPRAIPLATRWARFKSQVSRFFKPMFASPDQRAVLHLRYAVQDYSRQLGKTLTSLADSGSSKAGGKEATKQLAMLVDSAKRIDKRGGDPANAQEMIEQAVGEHWRSLPEDTRKSILQGLITLSAEQYPYAKTLVDAIMKVVASAAAHPAEAAPAQANNKSIDAIVQQAAVERDQQAAGMAMLNEAAQYAGDSTEELARKLGSNRAALRDANARLANIGREVGGIVGQVLKETRLPDQVESTLNTLMGIPSHASIQEKNFALDALLLKAYPDKMSSKTTDDRLVEKIRKSVEKHIAGMTGPQLQDLRAGLGELAAHFSVNPNNMETKIGRMIESEIHARPLRQTTAGYRAWYREMAHDEADLALLSADALKDLRIRNADWPALDDRGERLRSRLDRRAERAAEALAEASASASRNWFDMEDLGTLDNSDLLRFFAQVESEPDEAQRKLLRQKVKDEIARRSGL